MIGLFLAGLVCGVLSGVGVGGGTLLILYLTLARGMAQSAAQGINLLYFLPTAGAALILHAKNRFVAWDAALPAALCGCVTAALSAWLAAGLELSMLRKLFGAFLVVVGVLELRKKDPSAS